MITIVSCLGLPLLGRDECRADPPSVEGAARGVVDTGSGRPLVEILSFDGCPNHHAAIGLVERVARELRLEPEIRLVNVPDQAAARRLRFLGSPTIRVEGRDVDPHTEERNDYALSCRLFCTEAGIAGQPAERWVRDALVREAGHFVQLLHREP